MQENQKEIFKDIIGYEGLYQISNLGNVKSLFRHKPNGQEVKEKILSSCCDTVGYPCTSLWKNGKGKMFRNHRLVATAFIGEIGYKMDINHIDGIKSNNNLYNLEIVSRSENIIHAYRTGLNNGNKLLVHKDSRSGFANISPKNDKGTFRWLLCLRTNGKRHERVSFNIYEVICLYNQIARDNGITNEFLHTINEDNLKLYGSGLCCLLPEI